MNVYLTGVNVKKNQRQKQKNKNKSINNKNEIKQSKDKFTKLKQETKVLNENELSSDQVKVSIITSKENTNKTNTFETKNITKNNFISKEDQKNQKKSENEKTNEIISNAIKDDYINYLMLKEPRYADFDKISEEYQKQIYANYHKYNNNLLIIERKKAEIKNIVTVIEKSLVNNYFLKDSSMLPVYEKLIEKAKFDILTKKQEYDMYHKLYEELYNKNFMIKRKVFDEIDLDIINNKFYDQYLILKNHVILQISQKQEILNQIEDYEKKMLEENNKELNHKNKILKDLRLHIEVFKEDEKDLINRLNKLKKKREAIKETIQEKLKRNEEIQNNIKYHINRYNKSFISMNKIFKSVNAKNLDDVLLDVGHIKYNFNTLRNRTIKTNEEICELNNQYKILNEQLEKIKNDTIDLELIKKSTYKREDQSRVNEIKKELKKLNEDKNKINELWHKNIGIFQKGITYLFSRIKLVVKSIKFLRKKISDKLTLLLKKYTDTPFSVDYNNINKKFLTNFAFIFFKFSHIMFYLYLNSMSSGINSNNADKNYELKALLNKDSLEKYEAGVKKSLETYDRRVKLKKEKQKELNAQTRKIIKENESKKKSEEDSLSSQDKIFKKFYKYLYNKNSPEKNKKKSFNDNFFSRESSNNSTSIFFTGINFVKKKSDKDTSKTNSLNTTKSKFGHTFYKDNAVSYRDKKQYLLNNQNKLKNIFGKYQNISIKENEKNLYLQKKNLKLFSRSKSQSKIFNKNKKNFLRNNFPLTNKKAKSQREDISEKRKTRPKLMDEDYEYDEDEIEQNKLNNIPLRKNKTISHSAFFNVDKDRADIYKRMNDLRKLQMAYLGNKFLSSQNQSKKDIFEGLDNIFGKFFNGYHIKQNPDNEYEKTKKKNNNFRKKLVEKISANKKLRDKTSFGIPKRNSYLNNTFRNDYTYNKINRYSIKDNKFFSNTRYINHSSKNNSFNKYLRRNSNKIKNAKSFYDDKKFDFNKLNYKQMSNSTRNFRIKKSKL